MMLVFMATITWTWWINRQGTLYWNLDPHPFWDIRCSPEKRNRTVHILKNVSIVGALTILQLAKYESQASDIFQMDMWQRVEGIASPSCLVVIDHEERIIVAVLSSCSVRCSR
jgi:hypothetical protein